MRGPQTARTRGQVRAQAVTASPSIRDSSECERRGLTDSATRRGLPPLAQEFMEQCQVLLRVS